MQLDSLTILGVGLIGGSIGLAAKQRGIAKHVVGHGRREESLRQAQSLGCIDSYELELAAAVRDADLVVSCTPVDQIAKQLLRAADSCKPGTFMTDAGSTKGTIVRDLEGRLSKHVAFVGSHPLAGSHHRGADHASGDLFQGRITIVTTTRQTDAKASERIQEFWKALGSEVRVMDPESHDRALANTSHLPHLVASALAGILPARDYPLTATGFRDTTRIAAGDAELWAAIFRENALALSAALHQFTGRLEEFRRALVEMDQQELIRLLLQGKQVRDALGN